MKTNTSLSILVLLILIVSCATNFFAQTKKEANIPLSSLDFWGTMEGRTYTNAFFGFRIPFPADGVIVSQAETEVYRNAGADLLKSGNEQINKLVEDAKTKEIILVNYASKPVG